MRFARSASTDDDSLVALSHAIFAQPGGSAPGPRLDIEMPIVPGPGDCAPLEIDPVGGEGFGAHVERRPASRNLPLSGASHPRLLVWMRLGEPRSLDALSAAFLADAVVPPLYATLRTPAAIPSLEISVHFTARAHRAPACHDTGWVLGSFTHVDSTDGFVTDDGELWTPDGDLVAVVRQLRRVLPGWARLM